MSEPLHTYAACLTPPGTGAVATIALRGPNAWDMVTALFRPRVGTIPATAATGLVRLGRFGDDIADEVVLAVERGGTDAWVAIHGHGGRAVVRVLLDGLRTRGAEVCGWADLEERTGLSPERRAALEALSQAATVRTAGILLDQYHGAFDRAWALARSTDADQAGPVRRRLAELCGVGRHLVRPWRVVLAGAANVGKSSLANALAGYQRSVVAPTPGTTRDVVSTLLAVEGWPIDLADTAGLRESVEAVETAGIARTHTALAEADLCLWVVDRTAPPLLPPSDLGPMLVVVNKMDQPAVWDEGMVADAVRVSARTGDGIAELARRIADRLVPLPPLPGEGVPYMVEQWAAVEGRVVPEGQPRAAPDFSPGVPTPRSAESRRDD